MRRGGVQVGANGPEFVDPEIASTVHHGSELRNVFESASERVAPNLLKCQTTAEYCYTDDTRESTLKVGTCEAS